MRRILLVVMALTLFLTACACTTRYIDRDSTSQAVPVTPEMLEEISREIFEGTGTADSDHEETDPSPEETLAPLTDNTTVYWLSGGKVFHVSTTCRYIRDKEDVHTGTLVEASEAGKDKACSVCYPTK